ncbi:MAG TPA: SDR family oxidoreductase [Candidatus Nanoarchaeia archaeon]|nr:SDR family oxidoreductase [Candidatus Nanoarchaeia archaeon]
MLKDKVVLVTGAAKGVNAAIAKALSEKGAKVIIHYFKSENQARQLSSLLVNSRIAQADVTKIEEVEKMFKEIGDVDILINGVGNFPFEPITSLSQEKFNDVISSNLHSVFYTMKKAIPGMINKGFGRIINFGSAGAEHSVIRKNTTPYYIAKLGVIMLSKNFAAELGNGITVNCISPGVLETSYVKGKTNCRPIKLSEIVDAVLYLISNPSINGANLEISNGWVPGFT